MAIKNKHHHQESAIDYYKHGLRINPWSFKCIYNLATIFSNIKKHRNARKWYDIAIKVDPMKADGYYGSALSSFKLCDFNLAFETI